MGGSSGGGSTQPVQSSTVTEPWVQLQGWLGGGEPSLRDPTKAPGEAGAQFTKVIPGLYQLGYEQFTGAKPEYFPGQTLAGFNQNQLSAQQSIANRAQGPNPLLSSAYDTAASYASGDFSNPAIQGALAANRDAIMPAVDSRFGMAGRSFSPAHAASLGKAITNANAPLLLGAQGAAIQNAPAISQAQYQDAAQLAGVGQQQQAQTQAGINAEIERYNAGQTKEINALGRYATILGGGAPSSSLTTGQQFVPGGPSTLSNVFSGVQAAGSLAGGGAQAWKAGKSGGGVPATAPAPF